MGMKSCISRFVYVQPFFLWLSVSQSKNTVKGNLEKYYFQILSFINKDI